MNVPLFNLTNPFLNSLKDTKPALTSRQTTQNTTYRQTRNMTPKKILKLNVKKLHATQSDFRLKTNLIKSTEVEKIIDINTRPPNHTFQSQNQLFHILPDSND